MKSLQTQFQRDGYVIERCEALRSLIMQSKLTFEAQFHSRFGIDPAVNRNLIKRFSDSIELASLFVSPELRRMVQMVGCRSPVFCGPVVSHYTHTDLTGNSYGLPWHQDYPSMASSSNSVIVWISVNDCSLQTHSIEVAPGQHTKGVLPGVQRDNGYILNDQVFAISQVLKIFVGDVLLFSPYLPHRTFMNPVSSEYKLSFSRRFDDLDCPFWPARRFANAYNICVDRNLYTPTKIS